MNIYLNRANFALFKFYFKSFLACLVFEIFKCKVAISCDFFNLVSNSNI